MSKPRYYWHGYIKQILRHYPDCQTSKEREAVKQAIQTTRAEKQNAELRLELIKIVYIEKTQTDLCNAAYMLPGVSYATAKRWNNEFCFTVARNMGIAPEEK